jgi:hypothetical protein
MSGKKARKNEVEIWIRCVQLMRVLTREYFECIQLYSQGFGGMLKA